MWRLWNSGKLINDEFGGLKATGASACAICRNEHYPITKMNDGDTILASIASDN